VVLAKEGAGGGAGWGVGGYEGQHALDGAQGTCAAGCETLGATAAR
jgi:hypothetical protein